MIGYAQYVDYVIVNQLSIPAYKVVEVVTASTQYVRGVVTVAIVHPDYPQG